MAQTNPPRKKPSRPVRWMALTALAAVLAFAGAASAETQSGVTVTFTEGATGFDVMAEHNITAVHVELCDGTQVDLEVEGNATTFVHAGSDAIASVWVDAGVMHDHDETDNVSGVEVTLRFDSGAACPEPTETPAVTSSEPPCALALTVVALEGPMNQLTWTAMAEAESYNVYRAEAGGEPARVANVEGTQFVDEDVRAGATFRYQVVAVVGGEEVDGCDEVELTTIPVFPTALAAALAGVLGVAAYVAVRRRL